MKRFFAGLLVLLLLFSTTASWAQSAQSTASSSEASGQPPAKPDGGPDGSPAGGGPAGGGPAGGTPPDAMSGGTPGEGTPPGTPPEGMPGGGPGGQPESYRAVYEFSRDVTQAGGAFVSSGTDENAIHLSSGVLTLTDATLTRTSADSTGGDAASFYGVGAALLVTGGELKLSGSQISTDAAGGAGVFAYGEGTAYLSDTAIHTAQDTSGGIHVAGGGTLYATNLTVETEGNSSAAIRSDRGGGTMVVEGGSYISNGSGSPAVYVTADISVRDAVLTATGSEALCLEGLNTVRLYDSALSGAMPDLSQNDNTWTVILYQSMSGDAQVGKGVFEMAGGSLASGNGGLFYTTNTQSEFVLSGVAITAAQDSEYFLRATGNRNARGWGRAGANGAECTFTAIGQEMNGNILWDSISTLDFYITSGSVLTGAVIDDESSAGEGGGGYCSLTIQEGSAWIVTGDSVLTTLSSEGSITDAQGKAVSIVGADGTVYVQGASQYQVTVSRYENACGLSGAGTLSLWGGEGASPLF